MSILYKSRYIIGILVVATLMRIAVIDQSLWLDEAIGAIAVRDYSYSGILNVFLQNDNHPPLYYLALKLWSDIFGYSEIALRSLSVLFGVGTVYFTYKIARSIAAKEYKLFPLFAATLVATSQFHIYYSQEARMYSMVSFLAIYSMYLYIQTFIYKSRINWLLLSISSTLMVFTDYVPVFMLAVFWLFAILRVRDRSWWFRFILVHIPIIIVGILWLPTFIVQSERGKWLLETLPVWGSIAGGATFKQAALLWMKFVLGRISYPNKLYYYVLVGLASIPFVVTFIKLAITKRSKYIDLLFYWLLVPLLLGYFVSFWIPAFIYFRFMFVLPAFYLLVAWATDSFLILPIKRAMITLLIGVNLFGWLTYISDERQQREQWRQAVNFIVTRINDNEIAVFEYPEPFAPFLWYASTTAQAKGVTNSISANVNETSQLTEDSIENKTGVYYFEYLHDLSDPDAIVVKTIIENGFERVDVFDFYGVGNVYYYVKKIN